METTFTSTTNGNQTNVPFTLSPTGWGPTDGAYEASYVGGANGDNYSAWEMTNGSVVGASCESGDPYALEGYSTGSSLTAAAEAERSLTVPAFTNLQNDQYVIVWNKTCASPASNVPTLESPSNGSTVTSSDFNFVWDAFATTTPVTYEWEGSLSGATNVGGSFQSQLADHVGLTGTTLDSPSTPDNTYYWHVRATDGNGNVSPWSDTWTVKVDTSDGGGVTPSPTAPTANPQSVTAGENQPIAITLSATGAGTISYTTTDPTHGTLSGTPPALTYTPNAGYIGSDSFTFKANNGSDSNTATISITVQGPPILSVTFTNPTKVAFGAPYSDQGATITGPESDTGLGVSALVDGGATTTIPLATITNFSIGTHTILYVATDGFGNEGTTSRTVIVSGPPVITLNGDASVNVTIGGTYTELGATATDLADGTFAATPSGTVNTAVLGTYTITYNATDSVGNNAVPVTRAVHVIPVAPVQQSFVSGGGNGMPVGPGGIGAGGKVLGASIGPSGEGSGESTTVGGPTCDSNALLSKYMRRGQHNDPAEVTKLQTFLNGEMSSGLSVTGFFGLSTESAVKAFQTKYAADILNPWGLTQPTGYVYKFTLWKINGIICSSLNAPAPTVTP
jgi:hypothetical protein